MDAGLGLPLALLIGQQRDRIVFEDGSNKHVKLVGLLYDYVREGGTVDLGVGFQCVQWGEGRGWSLGRYWMCQ